MVSKEVVEWTKNYLNSFGGNTKAVIGISGGKDSTIAAKICIEAVGAERVVLIRMPQGAQRDLDTAREVCEYLGAQAYEINIGDICRDLAETISTSTGFYTDSCSVYTSNTPSRIRMTTLYGIAACLGDARVVNTCNRSEDFVGYSTKFGDSAGDFSPLSNLTVREVKQIGRELGIPDRFIDKKPEDGLSGKTDEENLGFTYDIIDDFLLEHKIPDEDIFYNMTKRHDANLHKIKPMPAFKKN